MARNHRRRHDAGFQSVARRNHRRSAAVRRGHRQRSGRSRGARPFRRGATRRRSSGRGFSFAIGSCSRKTSIASAQSVSREHGKTLAEARGSAYRGIENVEYACGSSALLMGDTLENLARGVDCETMHQPLGVCVGITPFNFPAMVPMWMFPLALACGNTFVLKPSEKVPLTAMLHHRAAGKSRLAERRAQRCAWRARVRRCAAHPSEGAARFRSSARRRSRKYIYETGTQSRQARPGQWRREKLHRRHAGRRCGENGRGAFDGGLRLRGRTLHGGLDGHHRGQSRRHDVCPRWSKPRARSKSARPTPNAARHGPGHHRRNIATVS